MILWLMGMLKYKINRIKLLILTIISIIFTFLFLGTSLDEDGDTELFFKRKPTLINRFNSPIYRKRFDSTYVFTENELKEEKLYQEFVGNEESGIFNFLPFIYIHICFIFISALIINLKLIYVLNIFELLIHLFLSFYFTLFGTIIYLFNDSLFGILVSTFFILSSHLIILTIIKNIRNIKKFVVNLFLKEKSYE